MINKYKRGSTVSVQLPGSPTWRLGYLMEDPKYNEDRKFWYAKTHFYTGELFIFWDMEKMAWVYMESEPIPKKETKMPINTFPIIKACLLEVIKEYGIGDEDIYQRVQKAETQKDLPYLILKSYIPIRAFEIYLEGANKFKDLMG